MIIPSHLRVYELTLINMTHLATVDVSAVEHCNAIKNANVMSDVVR